MEVKKTIKGRIVDMTIFKKSCLDFEYFGFQKWMIFGLDTGIYSSYKFGKGWKFKRIKYREYPLPLWNRLTEIQTQENSIAKYWLRFRTKKKRGGIWLPLDLYQNIPNGWKLKDSFIRWNLR